MKVVLLVMQILCVIGFAVCAILANNLFSEIMYLICVALNGIAVGMSIANLIYNA